MMDAQKRFLRFKLVTVGAVLAGAAALVYSKNWVRLEDAQGNKGLEYMSFSWNQTPEQAAEGLVKSMDDSKGVEWQGPFLDQVVSKVLEHSSVERRARLLHGVEGYLVQDQGWLGELAKRGIESNRLSEKDTQYVVSQGFGNLGEEAQRELLLELYRSSEVNTRVAVAEQCLLDHPGSVAKKLLSNAYEDVRHSLKDAGDWALRGDEE